MYEHRAIAKGREVRAVLMQRLLLVVYMYVMLTDNLQVKPSYDPDLPDWARCVPALLPVVNRMLTAIVFLIHSMVFALHSPLQTIRNIG